MPSAARLRREARAAALISLPIILFAIGVALYPRRFPDRSWTTEMRHFLARPSCATARAVGLAPAYRGAPGYWPHLDADHDGIACEPWPR
ncbi:MAG TPA: excalibur calcium-binding domain-containing protein [Acetobacteraceae bacterium]|nr:excalibur calcium-binding domain-containing protein [Acetobacteraceae bacterium]